jgi:hypothetical protein
MYMSSVISWVVLALLTMLQPLQELSARRVDLQCMFL